MTPTRRTNPPRRVELLMMDKGAFPVRSLCAAALLVALVSCAPRVVPPEPPPPAAEPQPEPAPPPPPPPPVAWQDSPATIGDWSWQRGDGGTARFGTASNTLFLLRCEGSRQISLSLPGAGRSPLIVRTSFGDRSLASAREANGLVARLPAADSLFDQIAFSRGHFAIEAQGSARLVLPVWGEAVRVIEECRG